MKNNLGKTKKKTLVPKNVFVISFFYAEHPDLFPLVPQFEQIKLVKLPQSEEK